MRRSLVLQAFLSMLAAALLSVLATGLLTRLALSSAFRSYLQSLPVRPRMPGRGMAPFVLGAAEEAFLSSVDRGMVAAAFAAVALAAVAALLLARALTSPLERLTSGAQTLAEGRLDHRVEVSGPAEVAALGEAFNEMAGSLQLAEELRARLVADVAHELRNPVAVLRAQVEGMAEGVLPVDEARLESLVDDAGHLSKLVDDLQELTMAEAGRLRYEFDEVDLPALVRREVERAAVSAPGPVSVTSRCSSLPTLIADERRISQVLRNLLSNSVRHTAEGRIDVRCEPIGGSQVRVTVSDTGEGISPIDLPLVFERFYRADSARSKDTGGVGIGLAISKRLIEDHGGSMTAESAPGRGTSVSFTLPLSPQG